MLHLFNAQTNYTVGEMKCWNAEEYELQEAFRASCVLQKTPHAMQPKDSPRINVGKSMPHFNAKKSCVVIRISQISWTLHRLQEMCLKDH